MKHKYIRNAMTRFLRHKLPGWSSAEIRRIVSVSICAGNTGNKRWTPGSGMSQVAHITRSMELAIARAFLPSEGDPVEDTIFVISTDPQSIFFANRSSGEDEETHIALLDTDARDERVHSALARMPQKERELLLLHYFQGRTLTEVGREIGKSKSRSSRLVAQARKHFRVLYEETWKKDTSHERKRSAKEEFRKADASLERLLALLEK